MCAFRKNSTGCSKKKRLQQGNLLLERREKENTVFPPSKERPPRENWRSVKRFKNIVIGKKENPGIPDVSAFLERCVCFRSALNF